MTTLVISEPFWRGTRHNVLCPTHGKIGSSGVAYDAEQIAIDHEIAEHFKLPAYV